MFSTKGLDTLTENLDNVPATAIMRKVVNSAKKETSSAYAAGAADGNTDYTLRVYGSKAKDYVTLTAKGNDVGFLEFGAGAGTNPDSFVGQVSYPVFPGSWGILHPNPNPHTRQYFSDQYWYWGETRETAIPYTTIEPTQGMQKAFDYLNATGRDEIARRIKNWIENGKA